MLGKIYERPRPSNLPVVAGRPLVERKSELCASCLEICKFRLALKRAFTSEGATCGTVKGSDEKRLFFGSSIHRQYAHEFYDGYIRVVSDFRQKKLDEVPA